MSWVFLNVLGLFENPVFLKSPGFFENHGFFIHKHTGFLVIHGLILEEEGPRWFYGCYVAMLLSSSRQDEI